VLIIRFKMDVIAYVYKKWCKASIIGRPIDVIVVAAKDGPQVVQLAASPEAMNTATSGNSVKIYRF
jgi:hypothetical protein